MILNLNFIPFHYIIINRKIEYIETQYKSLKEVGGDPHVIIENDESPEAARIMNYELEENPFFKQQKKWKKVREDGNNKVTKFWNSRISEIFNNSIVCQTLKNFNIQTNNNNNNNNNINNNNNNNLNNFNNTLADDDNDDQENSIKILQQLLQDCAKELPLPNSSICDISDLENSQSISTKSRNNRNNKAININEDEWDILYLLFKFLKFDLRVKNPLEEPNINYLLEGFLCGNIMVPWIDSFMMGLSDNFILCRGEGVSQSSSFRKKSQSGSQFGHKVDFLF